MAGLSSLVLVLMLLLVFFVDWYVGDVVGCVGCVVSSDVYGVGVGVVGIDGGCGCVRGCR